MLTKPDSKTIAAIARLSRQPDMEEFLKCLDSELETVRDNLVDATEGNRYLRLQGRGRMLKDIIEFVQKARAAEEKPR